MAPDEEHLIRSWSIELSISPHAKDHLEMEAAAILEVDLTEALPYLNAELNGSRFTPSLPALVWMFKDRQVGILSDRIVVDHLHEHDDVDAIIAEIIDRVNSIWSRRESIKPRATPRAFRQPLEIFSLLPQTNCGLCGEATCYSFALKLTAGLSELPECTPLFDPEYDQAKKFELEKLINEKDPTQ